jgi:hypothetical protein
VGITVEIARISPGKTIPAKRYIGVLINLGFPY